MVAKKKAAKASPKAAVPTNGPVRYHVFKVAEDMGEVTMPQASELENVVGIANATPQTGMFVVFTEGNNNPTMVHLEPKTKVEVSKVQGKDLFT